MGNYRFDGRARDEDHQGVIVLPSDHPHVRRMRRPISFLERAVTAVASVVHRFVRALLGHELAPHRIMSRAMR